MSGRRSKSSLGNARLMDPKTGWCFFVSSLIWATAFVGCTAHNSVSLKDDGGGPTKEGLPELPGDGLNSKAGGPDPTGGETKGRRHANLWGRGRGELLGSECRRQ